MSSRKSLLQLRSLPPAVLALAAAGAAGQAMAQAGNPVNGAALYARQIAIPNSAPLGCQDCHGPAAVFRTRPQFANLTEAGMAARITLAIGNPAYGMGSFAVYTPQERADIAAHILGSTAAPPPPPLALPPGTPAPAPAPAPAPTPTPAPPPSSVPPSVSPTATPNPAMFSSTEVAKESATSGILVTNSTAAAITFATPALVAPAGTASEFFVTSAPTGSVNCVPGFKLEPGVSCSFGVRFAPLAGGTRTETWTIRFAGDVPAREVTLEGAAIASATVTASNATTAPTGDDGGGGALPAGGLLGLLLLAMARRRSVAR